MPKLTDIARMSIGKQSIDIKKGLFEIRRSFPSPKLSVAEKLRTTVTVGNESKIKGFQIPEDSNGTFASWRKELEKEPIHDLYESQPLNKVKDTTNEDVDSMILEMKHKEWLEEIDASLNKWFSKRSKR